MLPGLRHGPVRMLFDRARWRAGCYAPPAASCEKMKPAKAILLHLRLCISQHRNCRYGLNQDESKHKQKLQYCAHCASGFFYWLLSGLSFI